MCQENKKDKKAKESSHGLNEGFQGSRNLTQMASRAKRHSFWKGQNDDSVTYS
ncbi:hypothetical protein MGG_15531 [Pyricularia oryzae 70-15]|uniref:Uncharacterized protein n=4 Tax=Pyricularia oryzae TaxID=318829 RepID=G4MZC2_PYRO7|nr:uncharacterized protein MGG_15531 [Pyricularia oryzae 70-15]ELQ33227.1 hypothetical protein OOU_Y34scaffold00979g10 [Pyricularia oryzae Y34]KAI7918769.1 hypothetical protein M0657_007461 [Pyricularia oryzae]EHA53677.1 hypothetical protein MGG_15531 [Pyricularia oryzae 70-15]KAI7921236.1 hypothetical protein M9X92_005522 [Pyricularia oryzae]QBZ55318.1 hypothetical protein PoMZ_00215 [Pyricularia oryzae]